MENFDGLSRQALELRAQLDSCTDVKKKVWLLIRLVFILLKIRLLR